MFLDESFSFLNCMHLIMELDYNMLILGMN